MTDILLKRSTGGVYFSTPINEGAKRVRKLMEDDYITLPISTRNPLDIRLGDYVDVPNEGRFCIIETQYPSVNEDNGGYDYDLKFEAQYRKWGNKIYKYHPDSGAEELSWKLTANIDVHIKQIKKAINTLGAKNPSYKYNGTLDWDVRFDSTIDHKVVKFIAFDNINILDAISAIAETFECECWVDDNILKFGRCEIGDTEVVLSKEVNLTSISRSDTGEKIANRIYPFGSTENLPKSYREDLVFYITNYDINDRTFSDKIRPLSHKWFDKSDIELSPNATTTIKASQLQGTKSGNISANVAPQSSENVLAFSKSVELSNLPYGTNRFDLTGVNISVSCSTDNNRVLSSILAEVVVSWEYLNESGAIIGRDSVSTQLIGAYIASIGQTYSIVLPESLNAKIEQFYPNANGIKEQVTTINCKLLLNVYCQFSATGTANVNISTMNTTGILVYAPQDVYRIKLNIKFLSGELDGNTYEAYYNNTFAREEEYANVIYLNNADVELLTTGDAFEITNINEAWIPVSYFSESMHSLDKDTINAIADKRLLLPEGMKPYIDAYRYANGDKVYIGEDGYDDATEMPLEEAQEDVVIFEDIKPDYTFEITKVWEESKEMTEDGVKRIVYKFFFYEDLFGRSNQFGEQYRIEGKDLMIRFSSGQLNGMEFKLHYWNETDYPTRFEVEVDENSNLPNKFFKPVVGDTFTMSGLNTAIINIEYLPKAEQRLFKKTTEYLIKSNLDNSAYDCIIKSEVMFGEDALVLDMGQRVFLKEETFLKEGRHSRVIGYEYPLDIPYDNPKYTIGEKASYSRIGDIESKLDNIEFSLSGEEHNNASTIIQSGFGNYIIGTNDDTSPSNTNVLSSLRSFVEFTSRIANESINYLWKFFKGIEIGNYLKGIRGASITQDGDAEVNSLQSRNGIISNNIHTTDFAQGALLGTGGAMYQLNGATYAEFDYLTARKGATFAELIIQEYRSIGGALVISQANGEIEGIYKWSNGNGYDIYLKEWNDNNQFVTNDLVRCQYWDRTTNQLTSYWVRVVIATDAEGVKCLNMFVADLNGAVPQVGDKLVQMGNTTDTTRQGCILLTTENSMPRMSILDGIDQPRIINTTEKTNYKSIYGSLDGFVDPYTNKMLNGYGLWSDHVYLNGEFRLSSYGKSLEDSLANISSGGKNLLVGTNKGSTHWSLSSSLNGIYTSKSINYNGINGVQFLKSDMLQLATYETFKFPLRPQKIIEGKIYHLSFDAMQTENNGDAITLNITLCRADGQGLLTDVKPIKLKSVDGKWKHYDIELKSNTSGTDDGGQVVHFVIRRWEEDNQYWNDIAFANLKLEEGLYATDWSLAPEDVVSSFTEFKVTAEGLTSRVENSEGRITTIEQTAEGISLKVGGLEKQTISTTNLLLKSNEIKENKDYLLGSYDFGSVAPQEGEEVTLSFSGYLGTGHTYFNIYNSGWSVLITRISSADYNQITKRFEKTFKWVKSSAENTLINIFQAGASGGRIDQGDNENPDRVASKVFDVMLTKSNKAVGWQPSSEDTTNSLLDTGINIKDKKIEVIANYFTIKNNNGENVASADKYGNWSTNTLITLNDDGTKAITINEEGNRILTHYYPYTNQKQLEEGWNGISLFRYYDENGVMLWQIGGVKGFMSADYVEWTEVEMYETNLDFDVDNLIDSNLREFIRIGDVEMTTYYQHNEINDTPKMYKTKSTNNPLNGWFTNQVSWQPFDSYPEDMEVRIWKRAFLHYTKGVEDFRRTIKWDMDANEITII